MKSISIPQERPLDQALIRILQSLDRACRALGIPYLLTGAMAMEILLVHGYGLPPGRATRDVDFGFQVADWAMFATLKATMFATDEFQPGPGERWRFGNFFCLGWGDQNRCFFHPDRVRVGVSSLKSQLNVSFRGAGVNFRASTPETRRGTLLPEPEAQGEAGAALGESGIVGADLVHLPS